MDDIVIQDLKQFISVTVSQQTTSLRGEIGEDIRKLDNKITNLDTKLSQKIDDLSDSVAQAISTSNDEVDSQLRDHNNRITKLEQKIA
jgi:cell division protein ZapA (FtsZ GTPase activity inhibitor)